MRLNRYILPNGACAFIDYAHNPASFEATLSTLRALTKYLIVVFEREEIVMLRSKDPADIVCQIKEGIKPSQHADVVVN